MSKNRITAYLLLLVVSVIWGVAGPVIKHTLQYFSPQVFLTYRFFISAIIAIFYFTKYPATLPTTSIQVRHTLLHSILTILFGLGLLFFGFELTDSLTGTLLASTGPVFSILCGAFFLREKISRHEIVGLVLAIFGSLLTVITADTTLKLGLFGTAMLGNALILLSRFADGFGGVSIKIALKEGVNPSALTHISFLIGFIVFASITAFQNNGILPVVQTIAEAPLGAHLGVLFMALISGTLGYTLANTALSKIELGEASLFSYLTVLWGAPIAILWLHDPLTPQFVLGAAIIAVGVTIAEWKRRKKKKRS